MEETNKLFNYETFNYTNPKKFPYADRIFSSNFLDEINNSQSKIQRATISDYICLNHNIEGR